MLVPTCLLYSEVLLCNNNYALLLAPTHLRVTGSSVGNQNIGGDPQTAKVAVAIGNGSVDDEGIGSHRRGDQETSGGGQVKDYNSKNKIEE